jgi:hypothetical protein
MANTYTLIASSTVGSGGAAYIDLTSIPSTYTDLYVLASIRSNRSGAESNLTVKFNNSGANYSRRELYGTGSSAGSSSASGASAFEYIYIPAASATASTFNNIGIYIPNYAGSNNKSFSIDNAQENNTTAAYLQLEAGLWSDSSAITSIKLTEQYGSNLSEYSTAYLYGISNS